MVSSASCEPKTSGLDVDRKDLHALMPNPARFLRDHLSLPPFSSPFCPTPEQAPSGEPRMRSVRRLRGAQNPRRVQGQNPRIHHGRHEKSLNRIRENYNQNIRRRELGWNELLDFRGKNLFLSPLSF